MKIALFTNAIQKFNKINFNFKGNSNISAKALSNDTFERSSISASKTKSSKHKTVEYRKRTLEAQRKIEAQRKKEKMEEKREINLEFAEIQKALKSSVLTMIDIAEVGTINLFSLKKELMSEANSKKAKLIFAQLYNDKAQELKTALEEYKVTKSRMNDFMEQKKDKLSDITVSDIDLSDENLEFYQELIDFRPEDYTK